MPYLHVLFAAVHAASKAPPCAPFPTNLAGLQCINLLGSPTAATSDECFQACCATPKCNAWNFSPGCGGDCCWLNTKDVAPKCYPPTGPWKTWVGGARSVNPSPSPSPPPPPAPPPPPPPAPPLAPIHIDPTVKGRALAGIGAISGGGATSRLLVDYPEPQRSQILDYMFTPFAGAALQILKVEIGGGAFTSDGSEASHMYTADDDSASRYNRGYEWWLMVEAKKRNNNILLYGLPWSWPSWVGGAHGNPWDDAALPVKYIVDWVQGAKTAHNLTIDFIGDWNETPLKSWDYNIKLRAALDAAGFQATRIVASDQGDGWAVPSAGPNATKQFAAFDAVGAHYPGVHGGPPNAEEEALLDALGKARWASEDGADTPYISADWARTINQNYVVMNITASIAWNLITSYDNDLPYQGRGIMGVANTPWCGDYTPYAGVWVSAHTTWFTQRQFDGAADGTGGSGGWKYVGGGYLAAGGSWVALVNSTPSLLSSPSNAAGGINGNGVGLTIVIEKMAWENVNQGQWYQKYFPKDYTTATETITFLLPQQLFALTGSNSGSMGVWRSHFAATCPSCDPGAYANATTNTSFLVREGDAVAFPCTESGLAVSSAAAAAAGALVSINVTVKRNEMVTLSTAINGVPSVAPSLPRQVQISSPSCASPQNLTDTFDDVILGSEAKYFQDMHGAFEAVQGSGSRSGGVVLRQMSVGQPVGFHGTDNPPLSVVAGQLKAQSFVNASVYFYIESAAAPSSLAAAAGAVLSVGITDAQCGHCGVYFQLSGSGSWSIGPSVNPTAIAATSTKKNTSWKSGTVSTVSSGSWHRLSLQVLAGKGSTGMIDGVPVFENLNIDGKGLSGWVGIGTTTFGPVQFDDFAMYSA